MVCWSALGAATSQPRPSHCFICKMGLTQVALFSATVVWSPVEHWISKYWTAAPTACSAFISWSAHNLTLFVFLFRDKLFNICCWFIKVELRASSTVMPAWMKLVQHMYFLSKACHCLLEPGDTRQHFHTTLGAVLKWNHQHKSQKDRKPGAEHTMRRTRINSLRARVFLFNLGLKFVTPLRPPVSDPESPEYWFWGYR